jgi:molecular chaperone DnaJ
MRRDYYAVLGVGVGATATQIRQAYRRLARRYSPDVNLWEREAQTLFEEIAEAYRVLSDPTARALYDRQGLAPLGSTAAPTSRPRGGRRGDDLHVPVELAFQQTVSGLEAELPVERLSPCDACGATGAARDAGALPCDHCDGLGTVWGGDGALEPQPCSACGGAGVRVTQSCRECRGRGIRLTRARVRVSIPPGVDTGAQLRVPGEGHAGPFGGPRGDLIVIARVHDDPIFSRKGDNLYCEVPVTIVEAVLGARVRVRGLDGLVDLVIPPGTQSGQVFRVRGKGMPRLSGTGRGDLYVTARVEIPRGLDARTQERFRELGRLLPEDSRRPAGGARA